MKSQVSFFTKVLLIVIASVAFILALMYITSFRKSVIEEKKFSDFKMNTMNILQGVVSDKNCLAYEYNETSQKSVIDINKLNSFVLNYEEVEPECAKALSFDYNIKVVQFARKTKTYSIPIVEKVCYERCYHRGYRCIMICSKVCEDKIVQSPSYTIITPQKEWSFGVPEDSSSPEKARIHELQISFPVTLRYNETFSTEGIIYFHAVKGELEEVYSLIEDLCQKSQSRSDTDIEFSKYFYFSYPIKFADNKLCMLNSCKNIICPFDIEFKNLEEGEHLLEFIYDANSKSININ